MKLWVAGEQHSQRGGVHPALHLDQTRTFAFAEIISTFRARVPDHSQMTAELLSSLSVSPCVGHPYSFVVLGFQTTAEARAFFAGEPNVLFDQIEAWVVEFAEGPFATDRDECRGKLTVEFAEVTDAVHFKLKWDERLLDV